MWLSKLKKKKMQYTLLGIIFTIAIALISVSTVVTVVSKTFAEKYYEGDSTPDIYIVTTSDSVIKKSYSWYQSKGNSVRNYRKSDMFSVSTNLSFNGKSNDTIMSYVLPIDSVENLSNKIEFVEGNNKAKSPKKGEMWIPSTIANLKNIKVGDIAKIVDVNGKIFEYKISAIVNDSNQSSTSMGVLYVYVDESERESLKKLPSAQMATINCDGNTSEMSKELIEYINEPLGGIIADKSLFVLAATMSGSLIGGLGLMTAIIVTIVLILILRSNIKNNVLKEYKSIGIYKAMGYSSKKIRRIYLYGYGLVSIIASSIGIVISIPMVTYICNITFKNLGEYSFDSISFVILIAVFLIFNLLVYINLYGVLKYVDKIKPVEAITIGITSSKENMKKSLIKNNSSSLCMAINDIFKYKKNNFVILIMFILVFYMSTLFMNIANTMLTLDSNLYKIFGTANSDLVIAAPSDIDDSIREVKEYLDNDDRVNRYYLWDIIGQSKVGIDTSEYKIEGGSLMATTYNKFNEEDFSIIQGVNPRNKKEVSLGVDIMKRNNLRLGNYITLNIDGKSREFLIVGSYASMMSNGQNLRLTSDVLESKSNGNVAFVKLKNIDDYEGLKNDIDNKFKGIIIDKTYAPLKDTASQVVETSVPISIILSVGVLIFGIFNIVNILTTNNANNRKKYGIMKSLGFTSKYIKRRSNYRIMSLAVLSGIIGVGLTVFTSNDLMKLALGYDVFNLNKDMTLGLVVSTFILIIITIYICNRSIDKISTVELIKE
ncbi:FtsX-like permease family protein [Clostridium chrysemydis]|uniref:ABC transporter permease n=1 Tax=Clostridium chrysemydis TaxID=2665504 RepID=UPI003F3FCCA6